MTIKLFTTILNHISTILSIWKLSLGLEFTMSELIYTKRLATSLREPLKFNQEKSSGSWWLQAVIEEWDLFKRHWNYTRTSIMSILIILNVNPFNGLITLLRLEILGTTLQGYGIALWSICWQIERIRENARGWTSQIWFPTWCN